MTCRLAKLLNSKLIGIAIFFESTMSCGFRANPIRSFGNWSFCLTENNKLRFRQFTYRFLMSTPGPPQQTKGPNHFHPPHKTKWKIQFDAIHYKSQAPLRMKQKEGKFSQNSIITTLIKVDVGERYDEKSHCLSEFDLFHVVCYRINLLRLTFSPVKVSAFAWKQQN